MRRLHLEILAQIASDRALDDIRGQEDIEQNTDLLDQIKGPVDVKLAAAASATQVTLPTGTATARFIMVTGVDSAAGVNLILDNPANDAVLIMPPDDVSTYGLALFTSSATAVYFSNPSSTDAVGFSVTLGCTVA